MSDRCADCRFWERMGGEEKDPRFNREDGLCRRDPVCETTDQEDWCGSFSAKLTMSGLAAVESHQKDADRKFHRLIRSAVRSEITALRDRVKAKPPEYRFDIDLNAELEDSRRKNSKLRKEMRDAAKNLRTVEIHQAIKWATEDLKSRFYSAIDFLEEG